MRARSLATHSVVCAQVLSGCTPIYINPVVERSDLMWSGLAHHVTPYALRDAFCEAAVRKLTVKAVLVVSPTYFGVISDIEGGLCTIRKFILHRALLEFLHTPLTS